MNVDTDGDGLSDYNEVIKGFDPNVLNESFNIAQSYEGEKVTPAVSIDNLSGEQAESLTIEPVTKYMLLDESIPGYIDSAFDFSISGTFETATISFEFDPTLLEDENFVPRIYYYNEETQLLEELPDQTVEGNVVSVQTTHFSKYILLNKTEFDVVWENEILPPVNESGYSGMDVALIIDASFNMASSDPKNVRTNVAKAFIDNLGENDRGAVGIFDYLGIFIQDFTSNHEELYSALEIVGPFYAACNLSEGINLAYQYFTRDSYTRTDAYKAVILLTDGNGSYTETAYTNLAAENGITIYTIGLGSNVNSTVLKEIAQTTGGNYYFASTTNSLPGIYRDIENKANLSNIDKDSNNDGISDYYTQLICEGKIVSGTGQNYFEGIDYNSFQANNDYDGDGLKNGEEVTIVRCLDGKVYVKFNSNPCDMDSDEDFLLDNSPRYDSNGRIIVPADPEPTIYNGPLGLWEQEYTQYIEDKVPHHYNGMTDVEDIYYEYIEEIKNLKLETSEDIFNYFILKTYQEVNDPVHSSYSTMIGAFILMFPKDELGMALHALPIAWQSNFGYNNFYDFLFYVGTLGQCRNTSFNFDYNGKEYVLWAWRGDYLNLGAGAELGIYVENGIPGLWDASDFVVPMSQSLYTLKNGTLDNVFSWDPDASQWWICGFNPDYMSPKASDLVSLERIDFSGYTEAYWSLKTNILQKRKGMNTNYFIFDDINYTVWFIWGDVNVRE